MRVFGPIHSQCCYDYLRNIQYRYQNYVVQRIHFKVRYFD